MEVAKLSALPNLKVRFVSCNESAIKRWLRSELEETVFSLTHELFMTKHHTVTLRPAIKSLLLCFCAIEVVEQSSRSLFKSLEDALQLDKDNLTKVLSSLADVALGLPVCNFSCLFSLLSVLKCSALHKG